MKERLQKIISAAGVASRREAEKMIARGEVKINGVTASVGDSADLESDIVSVNGKVLKPATDNVYIMMNKPKGFVTTVKDEKGRKTVMNLLKGVEKRVYPVGRLDMYSEGLLIFTNDGEFANFLMHPSHSLLKTYEVSVTGDMLSDRISQLKNPIAVDDFIVKARKVTVPEMDGDSAVVHISIAEGKNRQVRKMCDAVGIKVHSLKRISEGPLQLGNLASGKWRYLTDKEIQSVKRLYSGVER